ncbi:hypothetical protein L6452_14488 [Arctium lappa]|uniref:Uncharacterized protein n=1 Tax=Arctium lappa TaxID=4217 RepID=A0ACB9CL62_ARCLA|nr:hypothetical protein L6452_14488 [Arctium lappa]
MNPTTKEIKLNGQFEYIPTNFMRQLHDFIKNKQRKLIAHKLQPIYINTHNLYLKRKLTNKQTIAVEKVN